MKCIPAVRYYLSWCLGIMVFVLIGLAHDGTPLPKLIDAGCIAAGFLSIDLFLGWIYNQERKEQPDHANR